MEAFLPTYRECGEITEAACHGVARQSLSLKFRPREDITLHGVPNAQAIADAINAAIAARADREAA